MGLTPFQQFLVLFFERDVVTVIASRFMKVSNEITYLKPQRGRSGGDSPPDTGLPSCPRTAAPVASDPAVPQALAPRTHGQVPIPPRRPDSEKRRFGHTGWASVAF